MNKFSSIDQEELKKFDKTAEDWWDLNGEFATLHLINPTRISYLDSLIKGIFKNKEADEISLMDVGCGGGIAAISLAKFGYNISALDANESNILAGNQVAKEKKLDINFIHSTCEEHITSNQQYDVVLCLEVVEHVANLNEFLSNLGKLVKPGGVLILSTINRTKMAYLQAIIMAEYVLNFVPRSTHDYNKFVKPSELLSQFEKSDLELIELKGLKFNPLTLKVSLSEKIDVNYFASFKKYEK